MLGGPQTGGLDMTAFLRQFRKLAAAGGWGGIATVFVGENRLMGNSLPCSFEEKYDGAAGECRKRNKKIKK